MKIALTLRKEYEVKELLVKAKVRYWEDAEVNGEDDTEAGDNIPCKLGDFWMPIIDIETGIIKNWEQGKTADIHYKVCDEGEYSLMNDRGETIVKIEGYVPDIMCPEENGYGDYIIMKVDENGQIANWKVDFRDFETEE